jgi:hypothetical protein
MSNMINEEQKNLLNKKIEIIKRMESSDIKVSEYDVLKTELLDIEKKLKDNIDNYIKETYKKDDFSNKEIVEKKELNIQATNVADNVKTNMGENMANEEVKPQVKESKAIKQPKEKKISRQSVIIEVLQMKSIRNLEGAVAKVCEKIPNSVMSDVKVHIQWFIGKVKGGKDKRYVKLYSWDAVNFKLVPKNS